jgi:hypothetical protein
MLLHERDLMPLQKLHKLASEIAPPMMLLLIPDVSQQPRHR